MPNVKKKEQKELYQQLRALPWPQLWDGEARRFDAAPAQEREKQVAVVRAVGVVFAESGDAAQADAVKAWLTGLLRDPSEKIRRYAMTALPKVGGGETEVLEVLRHSTVEREKNFAAKALEKIGGAATLQAGGGLPAAVTQKIRASVAREENPSVIRMDGSVTPVAGLRIALRGRRGLELFVCEEAAELARRMGQFSVSESGPGWVMLSPLKPFSLVDFYTMRCFGTIGFMTGRGQSLDALAGVISSELSQNIFRAFTAGTIRYRLNFIGKGHQRGAVRALAEKVYAQCPEILNDARSVTWTVDIAENGGVELRPNLTPDPRFAYRLRDVPAASHPQVAAALARFAGVLKDEIIWDPFCGSGMELVERSLLGGVKMAHGSDLSESAISIAAENFAAAKIKGPEARLACADFCDYGKQLGPGRVGLIITNPPLGMRVPVPSLRGLIQDLLDTSALVLRRGGHLVFANPISKLTAPSTLRLLERRAVDFGGFNCWLEKYVKH